MSTSLWQTPQACTLIRTCPAPGSGISRSTISEICSGFGNLRHLHLRSATGDYSPRCHKSSYELLPWCWSFSRLNFKAYSNHIPEDGLPPNPPTAAPSS